MVTNARHGAILIKKDIKRITYVQLPSYTLLLSGLP